MIKPMLLIVDDEKPTREGLRAALEERYDVYLAEDAAAATELLEKEHFDVLLTDLRLPSEDGIICQARMDAQRNLTKMNPPQQLVKRPFKTGTTWVFEGTIGNTKVSQHYETVGEEDVDVPA